MSARSIGCLVLAAAAAFSCGRSRAREAREAPAPVLAPALRFVGRAACEGCHAAETARWKGSHHALAMQEATAETVLGDFRGARFEHFGVTSTFFRRDGKFFARTDGPDGQLHDYPIAYTFGVDPLQQYLVAFPGGRYQALNVVWDARPAKRGGQRWFHLYPKEAVPSTDPLHWTGPYQNWNFMCAECHSTNVRKGYVAAENRYETTFSEVNVACEACHGPGSGHVAWAEARKAGAAGGAAAPDPRMGLAVVLKEAAPASWIIDPATGVAKRSAPRSSQGEVEACGRCHARRAVVAAEYEWGKPLAETHRPVLLEAGLYRADGQIEDEVYEYGSFRQSKMYASGVTCTDCHNPHDLQVAGGGDRICAGCHAPSRFESPAHHFHKAGSPGARCLSCHMPTRPYMVVHERHDHSLRVPRPDLTVKLGDGVPNACNGCHRDRSATWAAEKALAWWGGKRLAEPHYGEAIHAGREALAGAVPQLAALAANAARPAIVRATALALLGGAGSRVPAELVRSAAADPDPDVRRAAVEAASALDAENALDVLAALSKDSVRSVRIEAARALAPGRNAVSSGERAALDASLAEYVASQRVNEDRPDAHLNLGSLFAEQGDFPRAESEYRAAIALGPAFGAAYVNLADLFRQQERDPEAEKILREGLARSPQDPGIHFALGLALVRLKRLPEAVAELQRAAQLLPDDPRYTRTYALALDESGDRTRALAVLRQAHARHSGDRGLLESLIAVSAKAGDATAVRTYIARLEALAPGDSRTTAFLRGLAAEGKAPRR